MSMFGFTKLDLGEIKARIHHRRHNKHADHSVTIRLNERVIPFWKKYGSKSNLGSSPDMQIRDFITSFYHRGSPTDFEIMCRAGIFRQNSPFSYLQLKPWLLALFVNHGGTSVEEILSQRVQEKCDWEKSYELQMQKLVERMAVLKVQIKEKDNRCTVARQIIDMKQRIKELEEMRESPYGLLIAICQKILNEDEYRLGLKENIIATRDAIVSSLGEGSRDDVIASFLWLDGAEHKLQRSRKWKQNLLGSSTKRMKLTENKTC